MTTFMWCDWCQDHTLHGRVGAYDVCIPCQEPLAARYLWLRSCDITARDEFIQSATGVWPTNEAEIDAAIDAAIKKGE